MDMPSKTARPHRILGFGFGKVTVHKHLSETEIHSVTDTNTQTKFVTSDSRLTIRYVLNCKKDCFYALNVAGHTAGVE